MLGPCGAHRERKPHTSDQQIQSQSGSGEWQQGTHSGHRPRGPGPSICERLTGAHCNTPGRHQHKVGAGEPAILVQLRGRGPRPRRGGTQVPWPWAPCPGVMREGLSQQPPCLAMVPGSTLCPWPVGLPGLPALSIPLPSPSASWGQCERHRGEARVQHKQWCQRPQGTSVCPTCLTELQDAQHRSCSRS